MVKKNSLQELDFTLREFDFTNEDLRSGMKDKSDNDLEFNDQEFGRIIDQTIQLGKSFPQYREIKDIIINISRWQLYQMLEKNKTLKKELDNYTKVTDTIQAKLDSFKEINTDPTKQQLKNLPGNYWKYIDSHMKMSQLEGESFIAHLQHKNDLEKDRTNENYMIMNALVLSVAVVEFDTFKEAIEEQKLNDGANEIIKKIACTRALNDLISKFDNDDKKAFNALDEGNQKYIRDILAGPYNTEICKTLEEKKCEISSLLKFFPETIPLSFDSLQNKIKEVTDENKPTDIILQLAYARALRDAISSDFMTEQYIDNQRIDNQYIEDLCSKFDSKDNYVIDQDRLKKINIELYRLDPSKILKIALSEVKQFIENMVDMPDYNYTLKSTGLNNLQRRIFQTNILNRSTTSYLKCVFVRALAEKWLEECNKAKLPELVSEENQLISVLENGFKGQVNSTPYNNTLRELNNIQKGIDWPRLVKVQEGLIVAKEYKGSIDATTKVLLKYIADDKKLVSSKKIQKSLIDLYIYTKVVSDTNSINNFIIDHPEALASAIQNGMDLTVLQSYNEKNQDAWLFIISNPDKVTFATQKGIDIEEIIKLYKNNTTNEALKGFLDSFSEISKNIEIDNAKQLFTNIVALSAESQTPIDITFDIIKHKIHDDIDIGSMSKKIDIKECAQKMGNINSLVKHLSRYQDINIIPLLTNLRPSEKSDSELISQSVDNYSKVNKAIECIINGTLSTNRQVLREYIDGINQTIESNNFELTTKYIEGINEIIESKSQWIDTIEPIKEYINNFNQISTQASSETSESQLLNNKDKFIQDIKPLLAPKLPWYKRWNPFYYRKHHALAEQIKILEDNSIRNHQTKYNEASLQLLEIASKKRYSFVNAYSPKTNTSKVILQKIKDTPLETALKNLIRVKLNINSSEQDDLNALLSLHFNSKKGRKMKLGK